MSWVIIKDEQVASNQNFMDQSIVQRMLRHVDP